MSCEVVEMESSSGTFRTDPKATVQQEAFRAVSFHDVEYSIHSCCRKKTKKILHGIRLLLQLVSDPLPQRGMGQTPVAMVDRSPTCILKC